MKYSYQCNKCGTTVADHWITHKYSNVVETNNKGLLTFKNEAKTVVYCPKCYEEEATNAF